MDVNLRAGFQLAEWEVHPDQNRLTAPNREVRLTARSMDVLLCLAEHAGEVVSREDFTQAVWSQTVVTDDALTWCISELRRKLGDRSASPRYIETIPKRGYRLIAQVEPAPHSAPQLAEGTEPRQRVDSKRGSFAVFTPGTLAGVCSLIAVLVLAGSWLITDSRLLETDHSVAVLPFQTIGTESDSPIADGIHHDLLTRLSGIADLRVTSRTSVMQFQDPTQSVADIADKLGVAWILEGSVQRVNDQIQLNAQLINARTDSHAWARTYQRTLTAENIFAIQAEITKDITRSLKARISPEEQARIEQIPTDNLQAYELFIRARTMLGQRTETSMRNAADLLLQITREEPGFANAWAALADAQALLLYYGHDPRNGEFPSAREAMRQALKLDPDLAYAHQVQGLVRMQIENDGPAALRSFRRAHEISAKYIGWLAWMEAVLGNLRSGVDHTEKQAARGPLSAPVQSSLALLYIWDRQAEKALKHARRARELSPNMAPPHLTEGMALVYLDQYGAGIDAIERSLQTAGGHSYDEHLAWLAAAHAMAGSDAEARALLERLSSSGNFFARGLVHAVLGQMDKAFTAFEKVQWNDVQTLHIRYHPFLDELREDRRYPALVRSVDRSWGLE